MGAEKHALWTSLLMMLWHWKGVNVVFHAIKEPAACVYFCILSAWFRPPPFSHRIVVSDWNWSFTCPLLERRDQIYPPFPTSSSLSFCSQCDSWGQAIPSWALWHCRTGKYFSDLIEPDKGCVEGEKNKFSLECGLKNKSSLKSKALVVFMLTCTCWIIQRFCLLRSLTTAASTNRLICCLARELSEWTCFLPLLFSLHS